MSEKIQKLVRMANQIADFFGPYTDAEAVAGIREHLRSFWTKGMRAELLAFVEGGGSGLRPRAILAIEGFRGGESPIHNAVAGPDELGQATSDAG
jgi:formate dehydrogenase subunit delta